VPQAAVSAPAKGRLPQVADPRLRQQRVCPLLPACACCAGGDGTSLCMGTTALIYPYDMPRAARGGESKATYSTT
jgi:hypothetical protein